jgi:hypothetical protein
MLMTMPLLPLLYDHLPSLVLEIGGAAGRES